MIQRIQTVYLAVATLLMALSLILPIAVFQVSGVEYELGAFSLHNDAESITYPVIWMGSILAAATVLPLLIIFLFKNRLLQIRLCVSEIVLLLGSATFLALYCYRLCDVLSEMFTNLNFTLGFAALMPVVAIIPVVLAIRGIAKDEALVRSLDRIR